MIRALAIIALVAALILPERAHAYLIQYVCDDNRPIERSTLNPLFETQSFNGDPTGEFEEAIAAFNRNPTNLRYFGVQPDLNHTVGFGNGHNDVWRAFDPAIFPDDEIILYYSMVIESCWIVEGDVVFNATTNWVQTDAKGDYIAYGDDPDERSVPPVALASLAFLTGFLQDCGTYSATGSFEEHFWTNGSDAGVYLGEDTIAGLVDIYSDAGPPTLSSPDVAVSHWRHDACVDGFGDHRRTEVFGVDGDVLDTVPGEFEPRFVAAAGQTVEPVFTYENLGSTLEEGVEIGFYWSADDTITTMDRRLGGTTLDFVRNDPDTRRFTVELPIDLPQGDGYLGVIVDETDDIVEGFEANNATYVAMRVDGTDLDGDGDPDDAEEPWFRYAAKVVCGRQEDAEDLRLRAGVYGTTVNVLNPDLETVRFDKRLAVSFPPDKQIQGETYGLGFDTLDPLRALETNCDLLIAEAFGGQAPSPYFEGFVVITSPRSLDVTAVYSTSGLPLAGAGSGPGAGGPDDLRNPSASCRDRSCGGGCCYGGCCGCCGGCCGGGGGNGGDGGDGGDGGNGGGIAAAAPTIDVEQIRERRVPPPPPPAKGPDLLPEPTFEDDGVFGNNAYCLAPEDLSQATHVRVRVRNQGDVAAGGPSNIRVIFGRNGELPPPVLADPVTGTPDLAPGQTDVDDFPIPDGCFGDSEGEACRFRIEADSMMAIAESNEANNTDTGSCAFLTTPG
ncbi:hypothetical protein ROJ8625_03307 [Roseivivax jejudonensis]|uniref:CARDB domain-containing protein n=1 Tax=Roseivivax jejudonensis TaxID=1529041 RepID=A0A1X6ZYS2_9RHOB|nr:hypothetical protein [Roseivivax jejudonensis]SLN64958.1 hypothetical protein ROJ8625_03307 [Roseivivax jejudonensis]